MAKPRKVHPDGIRFQGLRYLDPVLAAYVGESVIIGYDPLDLAEIRVFHHGRFLCRAICPDLAATTVSLKEIAAARSARRRELKRQIGERASVVDRLIAVHAPPHRPARLAATPAADPPGPRLSATGRSKPYVDTPDEQADQLAALVEAALPDTELTGPELPPDDAASSSPRNTAGSPSSPPRSAGTATSACAMARPALARPSPPAATRAGMSWNRSCGHPPPLHRGP